jgi:hypothetical protein
MDLILICSISGGRGQTKNREIFLAGTLGERGVRTAAAVVPLGVGAQRGNVASGAPPQRRRGTGWDDENFFGPQTFWHFPGSKAAYITEGQDPDAGRFALCCEMPVATGTNLIQVRR